MPVTNPIGGAFDYPQTHAWVTRRAVSVGPPMEGITRIAHEARGQTEYITRRALNAGSPVRGESRTALDVGGSLAQAPSLVSFDITGFVSEYRSRSLRGLTVSRELPVARTLLGLDVTTSQQIRGASLLGLTVRGYSFAPPTRRALTVRQTTEAITRRGLVVSVLAEAPTRLALDVGATQVTETTRLGLDVAITDGFMILADILAPTLNFVPGPGGGSFYPYEEINVRVTVAGQELPVARFDYSAAPDKLGAVFNVEFADTAAVVALNNDFTLALIVTDSAGDEHEMVLIDSGKIQGRNVAIQWGGTGPGDTLSASGFDVEADKFGQAPRTSVLMFDPGKVDINTVNPAPRDAVVNEAGGILMPQLEAVSGLTMMTAMQRAYTGADSTRFKTPLSQRQTVALQRVSNLFTNNPLTKGLGFERVITNIPDYPISRADFTLEGGWHDGCQPFVGMYNPIFFVEFGTVFVIDTFRALPYGYTARAVPVGKYRALQISRAIASPFNAVLLTYQIRPEDDPADATYVAYVYDQQKEENGAFGEPGYQRVETTNKIREVRRAFDGSLVSSVTESYSQKTYATTVSRIEGDVGPVTLMHEETQQDFYREDYKVGHHKEVKGMIYMGPDASLALVPVMSEDCEIAWADDPMAPGQKVQTRNHTRFEGLVYFAEGDTVQVMDATGEMVEAPKRYPALVAQASGVVQDDGRMAWAPIRLVTETLRSTKANQLDVMIVDVDLLANTVRFSKSEPRVSSGLRSVNKFEVRAKTMLIRDTASEAEIGPRIPVGVNAGELPRVRAIELAHRVLRDGFDPPLSVRVDLPGVDFAVRRGTVMRGQYRDGSYTPPFIVRGFNISGNNLGQTGHRISMSLDGVELRR